tara:strand:+ start:1088 stop:1609 length:522 start_codon:yes stop_codon:yes gene_type:complete
MNIFAIEGDSETNEIDWVKSAKSQDNYRVVKMILESCQMLCTTLNEQHGYQISPYRTVHKNHPSTKWVRASSANFESLVKHTIAMIEEYHDRFGKTHKCEAVLAKCLELYDSSLFPLQESTLLPLCMPVEFKSNNIIESYRKFYSQKPRMRYPKTKIPKWFKKYRGSKEYQVV